MSLVNPQLRQAIRECMGGYRSSVRPRGIHADAHFETLLHQLFDSARSVEYFIKLRERDISAKRSDPNSNEFDPIRSATAYLHAGDVDEAAWLIFLSIHFGIHRRTRWQLVRETYGALGSGRTWDWKTARTNPEQLLHWLSKNHKNLSGQFGNHRKYVSLKPKVRGGTGEAFKSYLQWIQKYSSHTQMLASFKQRVGAERGDLFNAIYNEMRKSVRSFGRTGCFDYLCALGKLDAFPVEPSSPYIPGSTGPRIGAELLLAGTRTKKLRPQYLDQQMQELGNRLADCGVRFAMQVLEDA
ncbi:alpha-glutamyl/putrescinyl thymine pyrophosphorylase clade 3 protein, partial [Myxococcus vastator]|uniref:alpha-glutamyl/putrescinyl thymine pyrophosphorylase clade 3 protein n=1 Tax=Myxococcus vastator TaxID=2709664 RepID=UPI0013D533E7